MRQSTAHGYKVFGRINDGPETDCGYFNSYGAAARRIEELQATTPGRYRMTAWVWSCI